MRKQAKKKLQAQNHLIHILLLAGFLFAMSVFNFSDLGNTPVMVVGVSMLYVALNVFTDIQANKFHADQLLEYSTIGLLAAIIILSF